CRRWARRSGPVRDEDAKELRRRRLSCRFDWLFSDRRVAGTGRAGSRIDAQRAGTCPGGGNSMRTDATADPRPEYRVAVFGLATRLQHLLEIVLRHARHNRYRYALSSTRGPGDFDVALVDMTSAGGADTARTLGQIFDEHAVLRVGRRCDPARPQDDLLQSSFVAQVLYALNGVIDSRRRREREAKEAAAIDAGLVVTEDGVRRRPRALIVDDSPTV